MGTVMTDRIFDRYGVKQYNRPYHNKYESKLPDVDFRDVLLIRNLYSAIVSGFLFHKAGMECDRRNSKGKFRKGEDYTKDWHHYVSWDKVYGIYHRTFCEYLAEQPEYVAMRAYIGKSAARLSGYCGAVFRLGLFD